jgi:hypothetical protein
MCGLGMMCFYPVHSCVVTFVHIWQCTVMLSACVHTVHALHDSKGFIHQLCTYLLALMCTHGGHVYAQICWHLRARMVVI